MLYGGKSYIFYVFLCDFFGEKIKLQRRQRETFLLDYFQFVKKELRS